MPFHFIWKKACGDMAISADINFVGTKGNEHRKAVPRSPLQARASLFPVRDLELACFYDVKLSFEAAGKTHHRLAFKAGIRQMTSTEDDGKLRLFINGRRFIARGGNRDFGESMLRYRAREYDAAVRHHRGLDLLRGSRLRHFDL